MRGVLRPRHLTHRAPSREWASRHTQGTKVLYLLCQGGSLWLQSLKLTQTIACCCLEFYTVPVCSLCSVGFFFFHDLDEMN